MADFGGMGGVTGGRELNTTDLFEASVDRALGAAIRTDDEVCREMWSALANTEWQHENGDTASYTFRAAGDLVAAVRGSGDYMDWYFSGPSARVSRRIAIALRKEGWRVDSVG